MKKKPDRYICEYADVCNTKTSLMQSIKKFRNSTIKHEITILKMGGDYLGGLGANRTIIDSVQLLDDGIAICKRRGSI